MIDKLISFLNRAIIAMMEDTVANEYTEGFQMGYMQAIEDLRVYSRMHPVAKVDPLAGKDVPVNFIFDIKSYWAQGERIKAIKYYREHTNANLREAVDNVKLICDVDTINR